MSPEPACGSLALQDGAGPQASTPEECKGGSHNIVSGPRPFDPTPRTSEELPYSHSEKEIGALTCVVLEGPSRSPVGRSRRLRGRAHSAFPPVPSPREFRGNTENAPRPPLLSLLAGRLFHTAQPPTGCRASRGRCGRRSNPSPQPQP